MAFEPQPNENTSVRLARWSGTLDALQAEGHLSAQEVKDLETRIPTQIHALTYLVANMGGHLTVSISRYAIFPVPIPGVGGLLRFSWTVTNRAYFVFRGNREKAKYHSAPVMIFTLIPFVGLLAYLYEVKRLDPRLAYVAGEQFCRQHQNRGLESTMARWPRWVRARVAKFIDAPFAIQGGDTKR